MMLIQMLVQSKRIPAREASRGASLQARSNLRLAPRSFAKCRGGSMRSPRTGLWRPGQGAGCACRRLWPGHARGCRQSACGAKALPREASDRNFRATPAAVRHTPDVDEAAEHNTGVDAAM